ncbi:MAG: family 16 glycoside hydrolase [Verrucomicrobiota bacterium]
MTFRLVSLACTWFLFTGVLSAEFRSLFDGKDLAEWKGNPQFWSVRDGVIRGETTKEKATKGNTFLIWQGGELSDFDFRAKVRFQGNNSGVQYRSELIDSGNYVLKGYQADLHPKQEFFGMLYGEKLKGRGIIAQRGQRVTIDPEGSKTVVKEAVGDKTELTDWEWNEIRVLAVGSELVHQINGVTTTHITDHHPEAAAAGHLGLQLHAGPPMVVEFKDLRLNSFPTETEGQKALSQVLGSANTENDTSDDWLTRSQRPQWVWTDQPGNTHFFRKSFVLPSAPTAARLWGSGDNLLTVWINGQLIAESPDWKVPFDLAVPQTLKAGENTLAFRGQNRGSAAGMVLKLEMTDANGARSVIRSDGGWKVGKEAPGWTRNDFDDSEWHPAKVLKSLGEAPWGIPGKTRTQLPMPEGRKAAAPAGSLAAQSKKDLPSPPSETQEAGIISVPDGFEVEQIYLVPTKEQGSWVSLTSGPQGHLWACDQREKGLYRISLEDPLTVEKVPVQISAGQGLAWAFGSLFLNQNGGLLHRLDDLNGDGLPDTAYALPSSQGGGEHGNHALLLSEDQKALYVDGGNHTPLPPRIRTSRVTTWAEDLLLPRQWDARGHARGRLAPGGWVAKFHPETQDYELYGIGFRNQYDIALNQQGDLFTFDADMEWDLGTPWYRPTRICHVVSGGDFGWRSGSGKWPSYYEDSLPPLVDIGPGSPTGIVSGKGLAFPTKYQEALFALDWTFGTMYAIHPTPSGAGYTGTADIFCTGSPLPLTDATVGKDGALYFTTGGRNTQSALYRIRYTGKQSLEVPATALPPESAKAHALRKEMENDHGIVRAGAVALAWPNLKSPDRFLRHAARLALESQPVTLYF